MIEFFKSLFSTKEDTGYLSSGLRCYVIGDIHGRLDLLNVIHEKIEADLDDASSSDVEPIIIYVGDYIDRGLDSRGVIECLLETKESSIPRIFLKGNHEQILLNFLDDASTLRAWRGLGGQETLHSYGIDVYAHDARSDHGREIIQKEFLQKFPDTHLTFLQTLETSKTIDGYFFVHAGIRPGIPFDQQKEEDLLWIRHEFLDSQADHGKLVVHGHTPVEQPQILRNRINIDTGAYLTNRLTCLVVENQDVRLLSFSS